jgi:hypothetical protein
MVTFISTIQSFWKKCKPKPCLTSQINHFRD